MDGGNTVDSVRAHDGQVGHVDPLHRLLLNDGQLPQIVHITRKLLTNSLNNNKQQQTTIRD